MEINVIDILSMLKSICSMFLQSLRANQSILVGDNKMILFHPRVRGPVDEEKFDWYPTNRCANRGKQTSISSFKSFHLESLLPCSVV